MASLVDRDGVVALSPSRLGMLQCPRRGRWLLVLPESGPTPSLVVGRAAHVVIADAVAQGRFPAREGALAAAAEPALQTEWARARLDGVGFAEALADLAAMLERLPSLWLPPEGAVMAAEAPARVEDERYRLRLYGRLDLLLPSLSDGSLCVVDWKTGVPEGEEEGVPLPAIGQAALGRLRAGPCRVLEVRWVYLKVGSQRVWQLRQSELADGWRRVRALAADVLADRWPAVPGSRCQWCRVVDCEYAVPVGNAADLGFVEA